MSLPCLYSPRLCLRLVSTRTATRQIYRHAATRSLSTTAFLRDSSAPPPTPAKRPGFLSRIKWYKETNPDKRPGAGADAVLTMYEDLPTTYRDRDGLPFAKRGLTPAEVIRIFGNKIKPEFANELLRILHGRRVAGTLDDPAFKVNTARFTKAQQSAALGYLRETVPVDETMNSGLRAEDELAQLERELSQMGNTEEAVQKQSGKEAAVEGESQTAAETTKAPQKAEPEVEYKVDPVYGFSAFDAIRARNQARIKAEEKRIAEEEAARGPAVAGTLEAYIERKAVSPRMQEWMDKASSGLKEAPDLSQWDRLAPSVTLVALLVAGCCGFAAMYNPPAEEDRLFPEMTPQMATVATIIGANLAVWCLWKVPPLWGALNRYFMLVVGMPRPITLVTAMFSHQSIWHLAANMSVLYYVGNRLHEEIGRASFLTVYLSSGALGYVASLCMHGMHVATLGASGAVLGVAGAYFWLHLWDKFRIMGWPAEPAQGVDGLAFLVAILLFNGVAIFAPAQVMKADVASHMGGLLSGIGFAQLLSVLGTLGSGAGSKGVEKSAGVRLVGESASKAGVGEVEAEAKKKKVYDLWGRRHDNSQ